MSTRKTKSLGADALSEYTGVPVLVYSELKGRKKLPTPAIYLYLNSKNYGHYICCFENGEGMNFFDSFGYKPDGEFEFANKKLNFSGLPYMSKILRDYGGNVIYNEQSLQSDDDRIATCGRWCAVRLRYSMMTQDQFCAFVRGCVRALSAYYKKDIDLDDLVCIMTRDLN